MPILPDHVRTIVAEIETEIGRRPWRDRRDGLRRGRAVEHAVRDILTEIGEDPDREGLRRTPEPDRTGCTTS